MLVPFFYVSCLNSLELIKILKIWCVLVIPLLFIGNFRQGKNAGGDESAGVQAATIFTVTCSQVPC
jgi:hypothetical protein